MKPFDILGLEYLAARFSPFATGHQFLDNRYKWQDETNGVEWPYYRFFYHLSRLLMPDLIVELGGYQGTAAAHFAAGQPEATVVTIDHHTDPGDQENKQKMEEACLQFPNLRYIQGWSTDQEAEAQRGHHHLGDAPSAYPEILALDRKTDILFIDSWHTYDHAMLDWLAYSPLLNSPALVICDDIQAGGGPQSPISGMMRFWDEMPEPKFLNSNLHPGTQMGFVQL